MVNPAGESLIWSLAKESGKYEDELRYPAEDSRYEIPKMKELGICGSPHPVLQPKRLTRQIAIALTDGTLTKCFNSHPYFSNNPY